MTFYDEWVQAKNTEQEKEYIKSFLEESPESTNVLHEGSEAHHGLYIIAEYEECRNKCF